MRFPDSNRLSKVISLVPVSDSFFFTSSICWCAALRTLIASLELVLAAGGGGGRGVDVCLIVIVLPTLVLVVRVDVTSELATGVSGGFALLVYGLCSSDCCCWSPSNVSLKLRKRDVHCVMEC